MRRLLAWLKGEPKKPMYEWTITINRVGFMSNEWSLNTSVKVTAETIDEAIVQAVHCGIHRNLIIENGKPVNIGNFPMNYEWEERRV